MSTPISGRVNEQADAGPVNLNDFELIAREKLPHASYEYFAGGAGDEITLRENRLAFERISLVPRVLRGGRERSSATTVLGVPINFPALIAPIAYQQVADPEGEVATARAAASAGTALCLSSLSTKSLEAVADASGPTRPVFFQLYPYRDRGLTDEIVMRAQAAGYRALVVTADVAVHGRREREYRNQFVLPDDCELPCVPVPADHDGPLSPHEVTGLMQSDLNWDDIERFIALSDLPVVVKGVLSAKDASIAASLGVSGVIVSNHGGRQLDTAVATIDVVQEIADAAGDQLEVLLDGGVRRGSDVVKAIALGARAVLIARPVIWALAADGQRGVETVLSLLEAEINDTLALCGCASLDEVTPELLRRSGL